MKKEKSPAWRATTSVCNEGEMSLLFPQSVFFSGVKVERTGMGGRVDGWDEI